MAAGNSLENLQEEITCAVCLDFFRDPVMLLECGHNFCRRCLPPCPPGPSLCPLCRLPFPPQGYRANRQLASVVAAVQNLATPVPKELCRRHRCPLTLFCHQDGTLLCPACTQHPGCQAVPLEEAAHEYRERFKSSLQILQEEIKHHSRRAEAAEERRRELLARLDAEKQKVLEVLAELRKALSQQESQVLIRWARIRRGLEEQRRGEATQVTRLQQNHAELQAQCHQPDCHLLRANSPERLSPFLSRMPKSPSAATVRLDPATAHPQILVSADGRTARRRESPPRFLLSGERFESLCCVLGLQGFLGGRHRWEVEIQPGPNWALGLAREFLPRKGCYGLSPQRGVWAVGQWLGQLQALTWPSPTALPHSPLPRRIRVALDYPQGKVTFQDAESQLEIFTFPPAAFAGERLRPLLWLGEGPAVLTLCP
ncbi:E3 ubiquitin-protein ligase TRIM11-like [Phaethornis superciliosus]